MQAKPDAFLSYARFDDEDGEITDFRKRLSRTVRQVSGEPFNVFQDVEGIGIGERWKDKLDEMLDQVRFFIPILTPSFFRSEPCRLELRTFLNLEEKVGRRDLVLPIYWVTCPILEEVHLKDDDELAQEIDERHRWDWRDLLFEDLASPACKRELHTLSTQIERARRSAMRLSKIAEPSAAGKNNESGLNSPKLKPSPIKPNKRLLRKQALKKSAPATQPQTPGSIFKDIEEFWCPEMVKIKSGSFLMGSPKDESGHLADEGPQHRVIIRRDFALGRYPVTFEEYDYFCEATDRDRPQDFGNGRNYRPVINVSFDDAEAYCSWLSDITNARYRLPTEAEWEFACRAGTESAYAFGDELTEKQANFGWSVGLTSEVGTFPANGWHLHDMHGNVWEWCADSRRVYEEDSVVDPAGSGTTRVIRGGSWDDSAQELRSACRDAVPRGRQAEVIGFRCARDLYEEESVTETLLDLD
ncbi:MAG: SUMF1/EgtB/PvdO family nonheme iron enzyme [Alphaproteobacteria bacterium]